MTKRRRHKDPELLAEIRLRRCCVCANRGYSDPSHIRSRGAGGDDVRANVVPMCRLHHGIWHKLGQSYFLKRYPEFGLTLRALGWEITASADRPDTVELFHPEVTGPRRATTTLDGGTHDEDRREDRDRDT